MKQPKENHPIDELFARKLKDHEKLPSSQSWDKIQGRLNSSYTQRRGLPLWAKYSAAASIAMLMIAGWWFQKASNSDSQELAVQQPKVITTPKSVEPAPELQPEVEKVAVIKENPTLTPKVRETKREGKALKSNDLPMLQEKTILEPIPRVESVAKVEVEVPKTIPTTIEIPKATEVTLAKTEKPDEDKTFIVKVVESEVAVVEGSAEKPAKKKKFFSRIAKGLKHIQEGEWKEVGLDSKAIIARTEDNIFKKH